MWLGARAGLIRDACVMVLLSTTTHAGTIFVDANCPGLGSGTGDDPFCSIQDAIDAAADNDEIIVGPGTYFETINFSGKAITVRSSDGPEVTTIDAEGAGSVVKCNTSEGPATVLDGFVLTGGNSPLGGGMLVAFSSPTVLNCSFLGNMGGGMRNFGGFGLGNPTVINCTFRGNQAQEHGGAMYNDAASPTVIDCTFSGNSTDGNGGGMYNTNGSTATVTNCTFSSNSAFDQGGGGMYNLDSTPTVTDCTFSGNTALVRGGGGMFNQDSDSTVINCLFIGNLVGAEGGAGMFNDSSNPTIIDCTFSTNVAILEGGGIFNFNSNPVITGCVFMGNTATTVGGAMSNRQFSDVELINCLFIGNSAIDGGGVYNSFSDPTFTNCTFSGNAASGQGGGMSNENGTSPTLTNCILWQDSPDEFGPAGTPVVTYSDVEGGWLGLGNIDADPLFVDAGSGDYRLLSLSPSVDAGNNWAIVDLAGTDLDDNPRFADDPATRETGCGAPVVVDMGSYELQGVPADIVFGDLDGNGFVGVADLVILNGCVGSTDPDCCIADLDLDGEVTMSDRVLLWAGMLQISSQPFSR